MRKFKAKKSGSIYLFLVAALLFPIVIFVIQQPSSSAEMAVNLLAFLPLIIFLWAYLSTAYWIDDDKLFYRSAFISGSVRVENIRKLTVNKTLWSGTKPALATNGIIVHYGYDEVYVAPKEKEKLIQVLLEMNPNIEIVNN